MSISAKFETVYSPIIRVDATPERIHVDFADGRTASAPTAWFPRLAAAPSDALKDFQISPSGYGIHWPRLDEDISVKVFVDGRV